MLLFGDRWGAQWPPVPHSVSTERDRTRESYSHSHSHLHTANLESPVKLTDMPVDCGKTVYSCSVGDSFL